MSKEPQPELLTVKETAEYLRIPLPTVYYLVQRGQLPAIQIGGRWRIKRSLLDRDILRNEESGQPTVLVVDDDLRTSRPISKSLLSSTKSIQDQKKEKTRERENKNEIFFCLNGCAFKNDWGYRLTSE